jgi:long-chain acyl-CoA synthetase
VGIHSHATLAINSSLLQVLSNIQHFKPDYMFLVPAFVETFYKRIWATAEKTGKAKMLKTLIKVSNGLRKVGIDLRGVLFKSVTKNFGGNLQKIVSGGAPLRAEIGDFFDSIGIIVTNGYGISECSPLVSVNRADKTNDCTTVGYKVPCIDIKFENALENGEGEICVKGDTVFMGYYKMPELTEEVLKDGWFYTGDYGRYNDKGLLMITGRKKSLIILSNGKNIFPEEIENYIMQIPYVVEVVVYGVKNEHGIEESLCAQVYLDEEQVKAMGGIDKDKVKADILKICDELPAYKKIDHVVIRDTEFEKTTAKKIRRNKVEHII